MKVEVEVSNIWGYFTENKDRDFGSFCEMIAESPEFGVQVWLSNCDGDPDFQVVADNDIIFEDIAYGKTDCEETYQLICEEYLTSKVVDTLCSLEDDSPENPEDIINKRERELDDAVWDFLYTALETCPSKTIEPTKMDDIKERILDVLGKELKLPVYRPMYLFDVDTDEKFYEEYPYEVLVD